MASLLPLALAVLARCPAAAQQEVPDPVVRPVASFLRSKFVHDADVECAALSDERQELTCYDRNGTLTSWDSRTGVRRYQRMLKRETLERHRLALSRDGSLLALWAPGTTTRVLRAENGETWRTIEDCSAPAFSPDGMHLAGIRGKELRRWRLDSGIELARIEAPHELHRLAFFPEGIRIAGTFVGSPGFGIWNVEARKLTHTVQGESFPFTSLAIAPDGSRLAAGHLWGISLYAVRGGEVEREIGGGEGGGTFVGFSRNASSVLAVHAGRHAQSLDSKTLAETGAWSHRLGPGFLCFSDGGRTVLRAVENQVSLEEVGAIHERIAVVGFSEDGRAMTVTDAGAVRLWAPSLTKACELRSGPPTPVSAIARDGRTALVATGEGPVRVVDLALGTELLKVEWKGTLDAAALSPDGRTLAVATTGAVTFWDVRERRERSRIPIAGRAVSAISLRADGRRAAWGEITGTLVIADTEKGLETTRFAPRGRWITALALAPDGATVVTGERSGEVRLWSLVAGDDPKVVGHHPHEVSAVAIAPDGLRAASTAWRSIQLHTSQGRSRPLETHGEADVRALAFSPDGKLLLGGGPGVSLLWRLP